MRPSPPAVDPLLEVGALGADRRVEAVTGEHEHVGREREEPPIDRLDDQVEVTLGVGGGAGATGNSVSPLNTIGWPSSRNDIEPGV